MGMVYSYLPFMILPLYAALEKFDVRLKEAAQDLGASRWHTFWRVTFPLSMPGVIAGSILVFIPSAGEFVIPKLPGGVRGGGGGEPGPPAVPPAPARGVRGGPSGGVPRL